MYSKFESQTTTRGKDSKMQIQTDVINNTNKDVIGNTPPTVCSSSTLPTSTRCWRQCGRNRKARTTARNSLSKDWHHSILGLPTYETFERLVKSYRTRSPRSRRRRLLHQVATSIAQWRTEPLMVYASTVNCRSGYTAGRLAYFRRWIVPAHLNSTYSPITQWLSAQTYGL